MTRASLCRTLGTHDRGSDGTCRDCGKRLTADDEVCREDVYRLRPGGMERWAPGRAS